MKKISLKKKNAFILFFVIGLFVLYTSWTTFGSYSLWWIATIVILYFLFRLGLPRLFEFRD